MGSNSKQMFKGEGAFSSAKSWDCRNRADLIKSGKPCHDAHVVGSYRVTVLSAK